MNSTRPTPQGHFDSETTRYCLSSSSAWFPINQTSVGEEPPMLVTWKPWPEITHGVRIAEVAPDQRLALPFSTTQNAVLLSAQRASTGVVCEVGAQTEPFH